MSGGHGKRGGGGPVHRQSQSELIKVRSRSRLVN